MGDPRNGELHLPVHQNCDKNTCSGESHPSRVRGSTVLLRLIPVLLSIVALTLMARDRQVVVENVGGVFVTVYAKPSNVNAFIYLIYANGLAAVYCFLVAVVLVSRLIDIRSKVNAWVLLLWDQGVTYVLLAAAAASAEVSYISKRGDEPVAWSEVCSTFGHFCNVAGGSMLCTFLSVLALAFLSIKSSQNLFQR